MLYTDTNNLEDRIVEMAVGVGEKIKSLHAKLNVGESLSLRAVYKAVHRLIDAGVLLKVGGKVVLDQEWVMRVGEKLGTTSISPLSGGERAVYSFISVEHLDAFWKTIVLPLEQTTSVREIFFYNPHNFWAYIPARKESEDSYYQHFSSTGRYGFFTIGGVSKADAEFKRAYQNEHLQIDLRNILSFRKTDHVTIVGSIIITVRLAKVVAERIDKLYASGRRIEDILPEIINICQRPGKIRFVMENNARKAERMRKMLARNFYFKRSE